MSIQSSAFGVTKLTKQDATKFIQQVKYGRPNQAAKDALIDGRALLKTMDNKGVVQVKIKQVA